MTEETTNLAVLLSAPTILIAVMVFYVARSLWIARHVWSECALDTKVLYLLVAPLLTLAVDILEVTDRLLWRSEKRPAKSVPQMRSRQTHRPLSAKMALRSDG